MLKRVWPRVFGDEKSLLLDEMIHGAPQSFGTKTLVLVSWTLVFVTWVSLLLQFCVGAPAT